MESIKTWVEGEELAQKYLQNQGYIVLDKNCRFGALELDLVCKLTKKVQKKKLIAEFKQKSYSRKEKAFYKKALKDSLKLLDDIIVFVEVKSRSSKKFGSPLEVITLSKQQKIKQAALMYLKWNRLERVQIRFDCIGVLGGEIEHIENAFS